MNMQDPADSMRRKLFGDKKPEIAKPAAKPEVTDGDGEGDDDQEPKEALHIIIAKKPEGGYHSKMDAHDGFPPDETDHDTLADAHAAHAEALESKFGEPAVEDEEEKVDPGLHDKVEKKLDAKRGVTGMMAKGGGYLDKFTGDGGDPPPR